MRFLRLKKAYRIFRGLYGNYKRGIFVLAVFGIFGAFLESFGVAMLIPLISHILQEPLPDAGFITDLFSSVFNWFGFTTQLRFMLPLIAAIFIARAVALFVSDYIRARISTDFTRTKRHELFNALVRANWPFLLQHKLGHAENTIMVDVGKCTKLMTDSAWTFLQFTTAFIYLVVALTISPSITLVTIGAGAFLIIVFYPMFRRNRRLATEIVTLNKTTAHDVNEHVVGFKAIKAMGLYDTVVSRIDSLFDSFRNVQIRQQIVRSTIAVSAQPAAVVFILSVFSFAFLQPDFHIASFAVVVFLIQRIFLYVERVQSSLLTINESLPNAEVLLSFSEELEHNREKERGSKPFSFERSLRFENVCFAYDKDRPVLSDISLDIPKGNAFAVVGPSGVGKTTIADLILRLITPTSGRIVVDGMPLSDIRLSEWRSRIGYVSQDLFLLNDTIYNNVRFYDDTITAEDVDRALEDAALGDTVRSLLLGMHTNVGERGISLSVGQRQRIVLARALVRKPALLILDEATSALDTESEQAILKAISRLHGKVTVVIIAHRLSTVREADDLIVLDGGRIVESGKPEELLRDTRSHFHKLHIAQQ